MEVPYGRAPSSVSRSTPDAVRSVKRALSLLALFSPEQSSLTLTQLAQQSGLALSTVSRLLQTLESLQFIRHLDNGEWGLGVRVLQLGAAAQETFDVIDASAATLADINCMTGENTNLAVRVDQRSFSYVRQVMTRHSVRHATWVGRLQPLKGTANGAVLLGNVPPAGYVATRKTIEPDITAIAAPIYAPGSQIIASLSITAPTYRITDRKLTRFARLLVDGAARVSDLLNGGRPPARPPRTNGATLRRPI